ncbi:DUF805 domain-containing protein [Pseudooceanicola batsensis]|nr:DUF805 domain-containing protein [Pseudooceanicola batsensis]
MTFPQAVRTCFRKYVTFSGRATRPEYWWFILFIILGGIVAGILDGILFGTGSVETGPGDFSAQSENGPIASLFSLATLLPILAVGWRRMHDTGRSGLYLLYPILVWVGIGTFASVAGVTGPLMAGDFGTAFAGIVGIVMIISIIIALFSPLIVIWWLTRPTQPGSNQWGPNPHEVSS